MRARSIRVRLTLWYVAVVAVTTTALAAAGVALARQSVIGAADATLRWPSGRTGQRRTARTSLI